MNYKEKYEKAVKDFKKIKSANKDNKALVDFIEYEYPELKESKDEKIVRVIRGWICALSSSFFDDGFSKEEMLAWLKKQGKQKPAECIQWTGKNLKEVIDFTGKSARFDEWFKSWDEYEAYVHSHGDIFKLFCTDGSHYEVPVGAWIVKTPDGYNIPSSFRFIPKLVEWSEEDEEIRKAIIALIEFGLENKSAIVPGYDLTKEQAISWLKKQGEQVSNEPNWIHHKVNLSNCSEEYIKAYYDGWNNCNQQYSQFKAEQKPAWNEEDEEVFNDIIIYLNNNFKYGMIKWLKSLKGRMNLEAK